MRYAVDVKDTSYSTVEVKANSKEEAEQLAMVAYYEGKVEWKDCDVECEARPVERDLGDVR